MRILPPLLALSLLLTACPAEPEEEDTEVQLQVSASVDAGALELEGATTLPDGALLVYAVTHEDTEHAEVGSMEVTDGGFEHTVDTAGWPPGEAEVVVRFELDPETDPPQPQHVVERYGERGERMEGPQVQQVGETRVVEDRETVTIPDQGG